MILKTLKDVSGRPNDEITTNSETTGAYGMDSNHLMLAVTKYQWHCVFRTYEKRSFGTSERHYDKECSIYDSILVYDSMMWMSQKHSIWSYTKTSVKQHFSWGLSCLSNDKELNMMDICRVPPCRHNCKWKWSHLPEYSLSEAAELQTPQLLLPYPVRTLLQWICDTIQWYLLGKPPF